MAEGKYTITLSDGTSLSGLKLSGNNFVSKREVNADFFAGKLRNVEIAGPDDGMGLVGKHEVMELLQVAHYELGKHGVEEGYYILLRDVPVEELERKRDRADIDYLAMMAGVTL